ncbi:Hypothetical protein, putative [Bodo saltans]|uniref:Uncharacterized protein n=1 Tax=Bodo saltans TaxID=75058 RepID=A0A0S4JPS3_BODSA|nr:Hypothetical protein, putative [Bodo saltans]|eukprot:CUG93525.1 Hypothetical protein, putative [Bodo saltans]
MLDPHIFCSLAANQPISGCEGSGFFVVGNVSRTTMVSLAFEAVINVLKKGQRALCVTHPTSVHHTFHSVTPLDTLPTSQLQLLEFVYTSTIQEALTAIAMIGMGEDVPPDVILFDISSLDDVADQSGVLRALAVLDNTIRSLRETHLGLHACFSIVVMPSSSGHSTAPTLHAALPMQVVPNPIMFVEATSATKLSVSMVAGAAGLPLATGKIPLFEADLTNAT